MTKPWNMAAWRQKTYESPRTKTMDAARDTDARRLLPDDHACCDCGHHVCSCDVQWARITPRPEGSPSYGTWLPCTRDENVSKRCAKCDKPFQGANISASATCSACWRDEIIRSIGKQMIEEGARAMCRQRGDSATSLSIVEMYVGAQLAGASQSSDTTKGPPR